MKKLFLTITLGLACLWGSAQNTQQQMPRQFAQLLSLMSDSTRYALAEVSGRQVLLLSHDTFCADSSCSDFYALATQLFCLDQQGGIVCLGEVRSQSTGTPVVISQGSVMATGHQFVHRYRIRGNELYLSEYAEVEYDRKGRESYTYQDLDKDIYLHPKDNKPFTQLIEESTSAKPIVFHAGRP